MLDWLLGKKGARAAREEDRVWLTRAALLAGLRREVDGLAAGGQSVVVVALTMAGLEELLALLVAHRPQRCADRFERDALRMALAGPGSVVVALAAALASEAKPGAQTPAAVTVLGRHALRADDDTIARFADSLGRDARIAFHLSLEDPLLQPFVGGMRSILEKLDTPEDEPIIHSMVTRSIAQAQAKAAESKAR